MSRIDIYRKTMNDLKTKVITSGRYLERIYESGIETPDQFQAFCKMCENHVDMCNTYCKKYKPLLSFLPTKQTQMYNTFRLGCEWSVDIINAMLKMWQSNYEVAVEEAKYRQQLEDRVRLEHEIAIEYAEDQYERNRKTDNKNVIGFKSTQSKKRKTNKRKKTDE